MRAHVGAYAANALLSVSDLTLLVRRGDLHDTVAVTSPDGRPRPRISVQVWEDGALRATAGRPGPMGTSTRRVPQTKVTELARGHAPVSSSARAVTVSPGTAHALLPEEDRAW